MRRPPFAVLVLSILGAAPGPEYDLLVRGGRVVDGAGNPWYVADVAVRGGRVAAVGRLEGATAARVLDARGLVVAPGFIDVHAHVEENLVRRPTADNFVLDGVTTVVTGNCGGSEVDLPRFFDALRAAGMSLNAATLIGHNSVRREAMGTEERDPTPEELARMEALVDAAMRAGAMGLSTGLIYVPGTYAQTPEVVALARVAARHGGVYASHIRNEGEEVLAAIDEAMEVGRQAGLPVQISHFKVSNKKLWGQSAQTIAPGGPGPCVRSRRDRGPVSLRGVEHGPQRPVALFGAGRRIGRPAAASGRSGQSRASRARDEGPHPAPQRSQASGLCGGGGLRLGPEPRGQEHRASQRRRPAASDGWRTRSRPCSR